MPTDTTRRPIMPLTELDGYIGQLMKPPKSRHMGRYHHHLSADHGGIGKGHGGKTPRSSKRRLLLRVKRQTDSGI